MTDQRAQEAAEASATRLLALYAIFKAGELTAPDFERAAAVSLYAAKIVASRIADLTVSTLAGLPPLGLFPGEEHQERLEEAVRTIVEESVPDEPDVPVERLSLLAEAESLTSHQKTLRAAIEAQGFKGYREDVAADACEVCEPFRDQLHDAQEGWTPHHPRCRCSLVPVGQPEPKTPKQEEPAPVIRISRGVQRV